MRVPMSSGWPGGNRTLQGVIGHHHAIEAALVLLMAVLAISYFYPPLDANTKSRLALVKAMVEEHRFSIDTYLASHFPTIDKAFYGGHYYSDKAIGSSLIGAEFYTLVRFISLGFVRGLRVRQWIVLIKTLAVSLPCAMLAPLLYSFAKQASGSKVHGLVVALGICLGTPFYFYSSAYYGHALAGVFLLAAFFLWLGIRESARISLAKAWCFGCLLAYAVLTEFPTALIALGILAYALYDLWQQGRLSDPRPYAVMFLGAIIPAAALMIYNRAVFGNPLALGYMHEADPNMRAAQLAGLGGIGLPRLEILFYTTFHSTEGIFWQSPILLLAFPGWVAMWRSRRYRAEAALSFCIVLAYATMFSGYFQWWGGRTFTPRHLIPAVVFFSVPLAFVPRILRTTAIGLGALSMAQMFVVVASRDLGIERLLRVYKAGSLFQMFQNSMIYSVYLQNFMARVLAPNLGSIFVGLAGYKSLIPLFVAEAGLLVIFGLVLALQQRAKAAAKYPGLS